MNRNPYVNENKAPSLQQSVFAFMDILGYSDLMLQAHKTNSSEAELRRLHGALSESRHHLEDQDLPLALREMGDKDLFALKAFTDNIVIGWPVSHHSDSESEFGGAISHLAEFQLNMAIRGYFVRGAISIGPAYVDDIAVFGDALSQAYIGESKLARDPRIIFTESAVKAIHKHITYYSNPTHAPQTTDILKDADGQWFLNYLHGVLLAEEEAGPWYERLLTHRDAVGAKLAEHVANPPIWAKFAWVANYHNYFCDLHPHWFNDEHRIDVSLLRAKPSRIVE